MAFTISSSAFQEGQTIPTDYTCDGKGVSPPLTWSDPPAGTQSLALIVDDPDAPVGTWLHWLIYNIPVGKEGLPENVPNEEQLADSMLQGLNDFRQFGYGGPCPPRGSIHRYFFKLYALDTMLAIPPIPFTVP